MNNSVAILWLNVAGEIEQIRSDIDSVDQRNVYSLFDCFHATFNQLSIMSSGELFRRRRNQILTDFKIGARGLAEVCSRRWFDRDFVNNFVCRSLDNYWFTNSILVLKRISSLFIELIVHLWSSLFWISISSMRKYTSMLHLPLRGGRLINFCIERCRRLLGLVAVFKSCWRFGVNNAK